MGFNPFKAAEKKAKSAVNSVIDKVLRPAVRDAERKASGLTSGIERKGKAVVNTVDNKIDELADDAIDRVRDEAGRVEDGLTEKLPELVTEKLPELIEDAAQALASEAAENAIKEALDNAADCIEMLAPTRFTLIFGVELALVVQGEVTVAVTIPNPAAKLTNIRSWAARPPKGRAQIITCIQDFGPESLAVEAKVSGNGIAAEWDGDDKYDRIDAFLEKHGVE